MFENRITGIIPKINFKDSAFQAILLALVVAAGFEPTGVMEIPNRPTTCSAHHLGGCNLTMSVLQPRRGYN